MEDLTDASPWDEAQESAWETARDQDLLDAIDAEILKTDFPELVDPPEADRDGEPLAPEDPIFDEPAPPAGGDLVRIPADLLALDDPAAVDALVRDLKAGLIARVREIAEDARARRGTGGKPAASWLLAEANDLAAAREVLTRVGRVLADAGEEAAALAADAMTDVLGERRRSAKIATPFGGEIEVKLEAPAARTSVDEDRLLDVLGTWAAVGGPDGGDDGVVIAYRDGVRDGISALRRILGASPGWKSTALAAEVTAMQRAGEGDLAARFESAFARVADGEAKPRLTIRYDTTDTTP